MTTTETKYQLRAKRDLIGAYNIISYRAGELFYPWHKGEDNPLFSQEYIDKAYQSGEVTNNCGHGCTETYWFPDDFDIETVTIETTVTSRPVS